MYFPQSEPGKLSRPWHGTYHIIFHNDLDVTAANIFSHLFLPVADLGFSEGGNLTQWWISEAGGREGTSPQKL